MATQLLNNVFPGSRAAIFNRQSDMIQKYVTPTGGPEEVLTSTTHLESRRQGLTIGNKRIGGHQVGIQIMTNESVSPFGVGEFVRPPAPNTELVVSPVNGMNRYVSHGGGLFFTGKGNNNISESIQSADSSLGRGLSYPRDPIWLVGGNEGSPIVDRLTRTLKYYPQTLETADRPIQLISHLDTKNEPTRSEIIVPGSMETTDWSGNKSRVELGTVNSTNFSDEFHKDNGMRRDYVEQRTLANIHEHNYWQAACKVAIDAWIKNEERIGMK